MPKGEWAAPIKKGEQLALKHGAFTPSVVDPVARDLAVMVREQVTYLNDPSYDAAVRAWSRAEAQVLVLTAYIDKHGALDDDGVPRPALSALKDFENRAARERTRLGLDPLSRAQLGRDVMAQQVDLARLMSAVEEEERNAS